MALLSFLCEHFLLPHATQGANHKSLGEMEGIPLKKEGHFTGRLKLARRDISAGLPSDTRADAAGFLGRPASML